MGHADSAATLEAKVVLLIEEGLISFLQPVSSIVKMSTSGNENFFMR